MTRRDVFSLDSDPRKRERKLDGKAFVKRFENKRAGKPIDCDALQLPVTVVVGENLVSIESKGN